MCCLIGSKVSALDDRRDCRRSSVRPSRKNEVAVRVKRLRTRTMAIAKTRLLLVAIGNCKSKKNRINENSILRESGSDIVCVFVPLTITRLLSMR